MNKPEEASLRNSKLYDYNKKYIVIEKDSLEELEDEVSLALNIGYTPLYFKIYIKEHKAIYVQVLYHKNFH